MSYGRPEAYQTLPAYAHLLIVSSRARTACDLIDLHDPGDLLPSALDVLSKSYPENRARKGNPAKGNGLCMFVFGFWDGWWCQELLLTRFRLPLFTRQLAAVHIGFRLKRLLA